MDNVTAVDKMKFPGDSLAFCENVSDDQYFAAARSGQYVTSHGLALFRRAPILYKQYLEGEEFDSDAMRFGRAAHTMLIMGKAAFTEKYEVADGPINDKTGKPYGPTSQVYIKWASSQEKEVISTADANIIEDMYNSVHNHPAWQDILEGLNNLGKGNIWNRKEAVVRVNVDDVDLQAKLDTLWGDVIIDYKTCTSLDRFVYDINDYGYLYQMGFYDMVVGAVKEYWPPVRGAYLVAVEKAKPYRTGFFYIPRPVLEEAAIQIHEDLANLKKCRETGIWPTGYEQAVTIGKEMLMKRGNLLQVRYA